MEWGLDWEIQNLLFIVFFIGLPSLMIWGWVRWAKDKQRQSLFSILSLISLAFASAACLLSNITDVYVRAIHSFPHLDPTITAIETWGINLSLAGVCFGIAGAFRKSPLRQFAPTSAAVMLVYWFLQALTE